MKSAVHAALDAFTREQIAHVVWLYGPGGQQPGGFTESLLKTFQRADPVNFARLAGAFPEYGYLIQVAKNTPGGLEEMVAYLETKKEVNEHE